MVNHNGRYMMVDLTDWSVMMKQTGTKISPYRMCPEVRDVFPLKLPVLPDDKRTFYISDVIETTEEGVAYVVYQTLDSDLKDMERVEEDE